MFSICSTMVEHSSLDNDIKDSNPTAVLCRGMPFIASRGSTVLEPLLHHNPKVEGSKSVFDLKVCCSQLGLLVCCNASLLDG
jgi:hypothetical protein